MKKKEIILPAVALFVICLVSTLLLAFANKVTAPIIEKNSAQTEIETRQTVLSADKFTDETSGDLSFAVGYGKDGNPMGMIFVTNAKSYGGEIKIMTGIDMDGKVTGVEILSINDTAGLGMNAKKDSFKEQFKGLIGGITVKKNSSNHDNNEITALTGATITSNAVTTAVNEALDDFAKVADQFRTGGAD
ncbi:MAG: FMN-binding protein [Clostridia bacterium]|nr:FMN-binding protein [Clostridia bacterium]